MDSTRKLRHAQQQSITRCASSTDFSQIGSALQHKSLFQIIEEEQPEHRERVFTPTVTLGAFLSQALDADASCQSVVNKIAVDRLHEWVSAVNTSAYCQARQRLPLNMVVRLTRQLGGMIDDNTPQQWRWHGRPVKLVDGTTVSMPDTAENQARFPQQATQEPGLGFPIARLVGIIAYGSGALLNVAYAPFQGKGTGEHSLLREILDTFTEGDIVVADRYYASYFLIAELQSRGVDVVMQQHAGRRTDFRKGRSLGSKDHVVEWRKPARPKWMDPSWYELLPDSLSIRELQVDKKVLVTTLLSDKTAPRKQLGDLYKDRWQIELNLREIKTTLGMDVLRCKTPEMVIKEIWVHLLAYNLVRWLMNRSATLAGILPKEISFKHTLQLWRVFVSGPRRNDADLDSLCGLIAGIAVGKRPGRVEPRRVKRRPKPYGLLSEPRSVAREKIRKCGHPKKA
ncbi:IS4 family transposase [Microbulbifer rhizosphaerae]|uniref:Transposase IS4-like domain-containing protein n=1 Tax=Microbulbifer rhizosphaerae TaxID=1562603 RepID=A0A7W4Z7R7_9GAMM|nr:IS4 family transposase [Microbulbifer rhizosphaerae]MBB3059787.1 hypothetical protein [Microbulbifer rhizosphaerae]